MSYFRRQTIAKLIGRPEHICRFGFFRSQNARGHGQLLSAGRMTKLTCTGRSGGYEFPEVLMRPVSGAAPGSAVRLLRR